MAGNGRIYGRGYYAVWYAYGRETLNTNGGQANRVYRFRTPEARDAWVREGPHYQTESGFREAVPSVDARVARAKRSRFSWQNREGEEYWPFLDTEAR